MKKPIFYLIISLIVLGCNAQQKEKEESEYSKVLNAQQFALELERVEGAQLVDVRTAQEFESGSIADAENQDILDGSFEKAIKNLDKNKPVFVYCAKGGRSGRAAQILKKEGFLKIIDLKGGYSAWTANEKK